MSPRRNARSVTALFDRLRHALESICPEYDNEAWRREALIRPFLVEGLGYKEHEVVSEIAFPITESERKIIAHKVRPHQVRVRPDFLIVPDFDRRVAAAIEAKRKSPNADVLYCDHFDQLIIEQVVTGCEFGILTDGENLIVSFEGEPVMQFGTLDEIEAGFGAIEHWVGRDALIARMVRTANVLQLLMIPIVDAKLRPEIQNLEPHELIRSLFPGLKDFTVVSPRSVEFNSVSWAAGDISRRWWPDPFAYWPTSRAEESIFEFVRAFATLGYSQCPSPAFEIGMEKVAIFALQDKPTHASRQVGPGLWSSKLGNLETITHRLDDLTGTDYGSPSVFLRRRAQASSSADGSRFCR
jgi:hypothetical protein